MKKSKDVKAFNILSYTIVALIALFCFIPFLIVVMGSITDEKEIIANGFSLFPNKLSLSAYGTALKEPMAIFKSIWSYNKSYNHRYCMWVIYSSNDSICTYKEKILCGEINFHFISTSQHYLMVD